jgi:hypothetical protein
MSGTERLGMRWVQKYISEFGGDPSKVMMYDGSLYNDVYEKMFIILT